MNPESDDGLAVTTMAAPSVTSALIRLSGDIDMTASAALSAIADRLATVAPARVVIDLAEVTFVCSVLPNFLAQLHHRLPAASTILLCRPTSGTRQVLLMTGMDQIATLSADLPLPGNPLPPTRSTQRASACVSIQK